VFTDTIQEKTVLDKKATIATGNLMKEGEGYKSLFAEQQILVDSLIKQTEIQKKENDIFRLKIVPGLESLNREQKQELQFVSEKGKLESELWETKFKQQRGKKWTFGAIGTGFGVLITLASLLLFGG
jgi:hypothetical protein